ncbi:hypothetical protein C0993_011288, partial [Termitomyces sp. T159_Od127]
HIELNPEHIPLNEARAQRIIQGWQEQHRADLEEDFNGLGPQIEMFAHDDLKNIHAAFAQMMQNPLEQLENPVSNEDNPGQQNLADYDPAGHIPEEEPEPLLEPAVQLDHAEHIPKQEPEPLPEPAVQPDPAGHVPEEESDPVQQPLPLNEPLLHYLGPMTVICPHCQALH